MKPIFCGNFEYDARQSDLERLFKRYGKVDRVDMKSGFAFVYMEDERDAEDAIRSLDRIEFGRKGRRLRVEWTKQERTSSRRPEPSRKPASHLRPSKTLFVINFDPYHTRTRDLERHFDPYGKILNVRIRKNFAFIQYENLEDATKALDATNTSKLLDRVITVEYAIRDDDERRNGGYSPGGNRDRSPRRGHDRMRSPSPYRRERGSPDYGQGRGRSPSPARRERGSPDYARASDRSPSRRGRDSGNGRGRSPSPRRERESEYEYKPRRDRESEYDRKRSLSRSPRRDRESEYGRRKSPSPDPKRGRESEYDLKCNRSPSPQIEKGEIKYDGKPSLSPSPRRDGESGYDRKTRLTPSPRRDRESEDDRRRSPNERDNPNDVDDGHYPEKRARADYSRSPSPQREPGEAVESPDNYGRRDNAYSDGETPPAE